MAILLPVASPSAYRPVRPARVNLALSRDVSNSGRTSCGLKKGQGGAFEDPKFQKAFLRCAPALSGLCSNAKANGMLNGFLGSSF